jgi:hypothetical protein
MAKGIQMSNKSDFIADVNVTFSFPAHKFPTLAAVNKKIHERMKEENPDIKRMPIGLSLVTLSSGMKINISDTPEVSEEGAIYSYPRSLFDEYSTKLLEAPNPIRGEVQPITAGATLSGIPADIKTEVVALLKSKQLSSRFIMTPLLQRAA